MRHINKEYFQSAVFGVNDALVSTTGVIVGVSAGTGDKHLIILAGVVTILVEALSMGSGQYLSSKSAHQYNHDHHIKTSLISGVVMFFSYILGGLVPLLLILASPVEHSIIAATVGALVGLFILGYAKGRLVKTNPWRSALEIVIIGGAAAAIGVLVGTIFNVR